MSQSVTQRALRAGTRRAVDTITDYGPSIRLNRGEVEKEEVACPDNPKRTVRRAKRVVAYEVLHRANVISDEQREACDWYLTEYCWSQGVRHKPGIPTRTEPSLVGHPSDRQLKAILRMRNAVGSMGCANRALVDLLILDNLSVRELTARLKIRQPTVITALQEALTALCKHLGI
jgi:hypothetical protein